MKIVLRVLVILGVTYALLFTVVLIAMCQTPSRFGRFMRYAPAPIVWGALPAQRMWLWARRGALEVGDEAPTFTLPYHDGKGTVSLAQHRGERPVILVVGSYT